MSRRPPGPPPALSMLKAPREPFLDVEIHLVTPLFGGGAEPGVVDRELPVRGSTVRGHLRFWWRACIGARFSSAEELFTAEALIWGSASGAGGAGPAPSAIDLSVDVTKRGTLAPCVQNARWPSYVVFPFQEQRGAPPRDALQGLVFSLHFTRARHVAAHQERELRRAVEVALWAWVTFGGLGARTRRGCGALYCAEYAPSGNPAAWLKQAADLHVARAERRLPIPVLSGARALVAGQIEAPVAAWSRVAGWLQGFRQQKMDAAAGARGRSAWPDAHGARQMLENGRRTGGGTLGPSTPPYFPRADLGLPLIFQRLGGTSGDATLELHGEGASRLASPVIVKPLALAPDRALPLAVVLNAPHVWQAAPGSVQLRTEGGSLRVDDEALYSAARSRAVGPLLQRETARDAFLEYVRRQPTRVEQVTL